MCIQTATIRISVNKFFGTIKVSFVAVVIGYTITGTAASAHSHKTGVVMYPALLERKRRYWKWAKTRKPMEGKCEREIEREGK